MARADGGDARGMMKLSGMCMAAVSHQGGSHAELAFTPAISCTVLTPPSYSLLLYTHSSLTPPALIAGT